MGNNSTNNLGVDTMLPNKHRAVGITTALSLMITSQVAPLLMADSRQYQPEALEEITVIGTAITGRSLNLDALPYAAQRFTADELSDRTFFSAVDLLENRAASVSTNAAQNNRLQPDLQYRGFTASPLLGLSQGLAVYQNGVRVNEAFGDTVNWDLLPASSMAQLDLIGGSNPVYGLNTIGGALTITTQTGFSAEGGDISYTAGDFSTRDYTALYGANNGAWGFFIAVDAMEEDGWRDFSESDANTVYSALSWRGERSELDLFVNYGDSNLKGNGSVPLDLLNQRRSAVFTHPDQTENSLRMGSLSLRHQFDEGLKLSANVFYRDLETFTFNGDGAEYEECGEDDEGDLDAGKLEDLDDDDEDHPFEGYLCNEDGEVVTDKDGMLVEEDFNGINNRSRRLQESHGFTVQIQGETDFGTMNHQYLIGIDYFRGKTQFDSNVEFSQLTATRGTTLTGRYDQEGNTNLNTEIETWSVFLSDYLTLTDAIGLSLSARYNTTHSVGVDPTGQRPELAGDHTFDNVNLGAGVLWQINAQTSVYANLQTSTRTPTPVELACSHPDAPCTLPNTFLADPPLDEVTSVSTELGIRGSNHWLQRYRLGGFLIRADDDIVFQTTGGVSSNQGFFQNAADTQRLGLELELAGGGERWSWYLNYTRMDATYESAFFASSPNNPASVNDKLLVRSGSHIPLLPHNNLKMGASFQLLEATRVGLDYRYQEGVHLRGDEANVDAKTDAWQVVDLYARTTVGDHVYIEARLDNAFDTQYETFGLYGEADEVLPEVSDDSGRFLGPAMPRIWWLTLGVQW